MVLKLLENSKLKNRFWEGLFSLFFEGIRSPFAG